MTILPMRKNGPKSPGHSTGAQEVHAPQRLFPLWLLFQVQSRERQWHWACAPQCTWGAVSPVEAAASLGAPAPSGQATFSFPRTLAQPGKGGLAQERRGSSSCK